MQTRGSAPRQEFVHPRCRTNNGATNNITQKHHHHFCYAGVRESLWKCGANGSIPQMTHDWIWCSCGTILTAKPRRTGRKIRPRTTSPTTNPTYIDLGANSDLLDEKPATNSLRYGMASTREHNECSHSARRILPYRPHRLYIKHFHTIQNRKSSNENGQKDSVIKPSVR